MILNRSFVAVALVTLIGCSSTSVTQSSNEHDAGDVGGNTSFRSSTGHTGGAGGTSKQSGITGGMPTTATNTGGSSAVGGDGSGGASHTTGTLSAGGALATGGLGGVVGGNTASTAGGSSSVGGSRALGGASTTVSPTGGATPAGGVASTGGAPASAGATPAGGIAATGGTAATGGIAATGGTAATGGMVATGGIVATGGMAATGGIVAAGGSSATTAACYSASYNTEGSPLATQGTQDLDTFTTLSCNTGTTSPQLVVKWTAPGTGWYSLNSAGSSFNTVLGVFSNSCTSPQQLACNDDAGTGTGTTSEVVRKFSKGDTVLVVIGGKAGAVGTAKFSATRITCPAQDLTGGTSYTGLSTQGGVTLPAGSDMSYGLCGWDQYNSQIANTQQATEQYFLWTPESSGLYEFSAVSSDGPMTLHLQNGAKCGSELLGCNYSAGGPSEPALVARYLQAQQPVTIGVASVGANSAATFDLSISKLNVTCPNVTVSDITGLDGRSGTLDQNVSKITGTSCYASGTGFIPELAYAFSVNIPTGSTSQCALTVTGVNNGISTTLLKGNQCEGAEVANMCHSSGTTSNYWFTRAENGLYTLVVMGPWESGILQTYNFTISASCSS